jgi:peptidoglycan hydrolase CwlO-like protein
MSFFGGGGDNSALVGAQMNALREEKAKADAEAARLKAENDKAAAAAETKRVQRAKAGGLSAFTTNGYAGYSDRTLGAGNSVSV